MLISKVDEDNAGACGEGAAAGGAASRLFEEMARDHQYDTKEDDELTDRDLVVLYNNLDLGTQLMSTAGINRPITVPKRPNQHVETVVYRGDASDSDDSGNISKEDLQVLVNKEKEYLMKTRLSEGNPLSSKFDGLEIHSSDLAAECNESICKDPVIQLRTLRLQLEGSVLPTSLFDYMACKRLEDNYNFYMDNIIRYVTHTIDQLKRISNGDYLTDRAKEKWREVNADDESHNNGEKNKKVLESTTNIPLHVEVKNTGHVTKWDDLVRSEVDVRTLSKILEKKIVIEVPKMICGSYKLFSQCSVDNLVISCKRQDESHDARVDVLLKLQKSKSGHVVSNISSLMVLPAAPNINGANKPLALPFKEKPESTSSIERTVNLALNPDINNTIQESFLIQDADETTRVEEITKTVEISPPVEEAIPLVVASSDVYILADDRSTADLEEDEQSFNSNEVPLFEPQNNLHNNTDDECEFVIATPDELNMRMQTLHEPTAETEETGVITQTQNKPKSPTKARIKSPYENKSLLIEEKKRKKLIEIRERREKMKLKNNAKHKYGKVSVAPQASTSTTKLSITNKSFYNSIYGRAHKQNNTQLQAKAPRKLQDNEESVSAKEESGEPNLAIDQNIKTNETTNGNKKYINHSYYLDDVETAITQSPKRDTSFRSSSAELGSDFNAQLTLLSQLMKASRTREGRKSVSFDTQLQRSHSNGEIPKVDQSQKQTQLNVSSVRCSDEDLENEDDDGSKKISLQCRKSIDRVYDLMKKIGNNFEPKHTKSKFSTIVKHEKIDEIYPDSMVQGTGSGTSLKNHPGHSTPSNFSFEANDKTQTNTMQKEPETHNSVGTLQQKAFLSSKQKTKPKPMVKEKISIVDSKKENNPLRAISQLLRNINTVRKNADIPKNRNVAEPKIQAKVNTGPNDIKRIPRQVISPRMSRMDQTKVFKPPENQKVYRPPERRPKQPSILEQKLAVGDRRFDRFRRKRDSEINDEEKEARGEAVRGPSKRINALAQPRKPYFPAREETQLNKSRISTRLKMPTNIQQAVEKLGIASQGKTVSVVSNLAAVQTSAEQNRRQLSANSKQPSLPLDETSRSPKSRKLSPTIRDTNSSVVTCQPPSKLAARETPLKSTKLEAVNTNVNNNLENATESSPSVIVAREPYLPIDLEEGSLTTIVDEDASALAGELHNTVHNILFSTDLQHSDLGQVCESKPSQQTSPKLNKSMSATSDYPTDVFEDIDVVTAVANVPNDSRSQIDSKETQKSSVEMRILENALKKKKLKVANKRLRINNLTLTPKGSMQQIILVQSGDDGSVVVKSEISLDMRTRNSKSDIELRYLGDMKDINCPRNNFCAIPTQVTTVGYAFPQYYLGSSAILNTVKDLSISTSSNVLRVINPVSSEQSRDANALSHMASETSLDVNAKRLCRKLYKYHKNIKNQEHHRSRIEINAAHNKVVLSNIPKETCTEVEKPFQKQNDRKDDKKGMECEHNSLDILIGLLNEIQKISTCQRNITTPEGLDNLQSKELETIFKEPKTLDKMQMLDIVSKSSMNNSGKLESLQSIYSVLVSNDGLLSRATMTLAADLFRSAFAQTCEDKEVYANIPERERVNQCTDVPSIILDANDHKTEGPVVQMINAPKHDSDCRIAEVMDDDVTYRKTNGVANVKDSNGDVNFKESKNYVNAKDSNYNITAMVSNGHVIAKEGPGKHQNLDTVIVKSLTQIDKSRENIPLTKSAPRITCTKELKKVEFVHETVTKGCSDSDPLLRMKRDILVTFYSILVFTVFAALSFPGVMYRV